MDKGFEKYLQNFLRENGIDSNNMDSSQICDFKTLINQLTVCDTDSAAIRRHLKIMFFLRKKSICFYQDDYKTKKEYLAIKDNWLPVNKTVIMSVENYIEHFLIDRSRLEKLYKSESIYAMGNPYELNQEEYKFAEALITQRSYFTDDEEFTDPADPAQISYKIKNADRNFITQLWRKSFQSLHRTGHSTGGLVTRLHRDIQFRIVDFPLEKEYKAEICKIIYFFTMLEHTTKIPCMQGKDVKPRKGGKNEQYFNLTDFLSEPSMENTGAKFLCDETSKRLNGRITDFIKNELEKEINLREQTVSEIGHVRTEFKNIVSVWKKIFSNVHKAVDTNLEVDFEQMIRTCNLINPQFLPYKELQRQFGFQNQDSEPCISTTENRYCASPIIALYFRILEFEFSGEVEDRRFLNKLQVDSNYDVPQNFIERMREYKDHYIECEDVEKYIKKNIGSIAECVYLKSNITDAEKKRLRDHIKDILNVSGSYAYAKGNRKSEHEISELLIISCMQAIIHDKDAPDDEYTFYDYQHHMKSSHKPKISCKPIDEKRTHLTVQKLYWAQRVEAHWYANIGKYALYCKSKIFEEYLYRILTRLCSTDNIEEMKRYSEECYGKLEPFFKESSPEGQVIS